MSDVPFLFDANTIARLQDLMGHGWPEPWRIITLLGSNWGILLVLGIALWLHGRGIAYAILAVVTVDGVLKTVLNQLLFLPRPDGGGIVKYESVGVGSFPSGHVSTAAALWAYLAHRRAIRWSVAVVVIALVAVSRLYLGVHYVGDILGGLLLAALVVWLVSRLWPPLRERLSRLPFGAWAGVSLVLLAGAVAGAFFYYGGNPYRWRAGGLVAGLAIALPLEYRFVRYRPGHDSAGRRVAKVAIGGAGIAAAGAVDLITGELSNSLGMTAVALGAIWTVLVAPTLFVELGWAGEDDLRREPAFRGVSRALGVAALVLALLVGYGLGVEPRLMLDTEEHEVTIPGLADGWEGQTVAVASDYQLGLWLDNRGLMEESVRAIVEREPALVLLAGDFIYEAGDDPTPVVTGIMDVLRPLVRSGIPTYAVLGNHDWGLSRPVPDAEPNRAAGRELTDSLETAGIAVLENEHVPVVGPAGDTLWVVGIASHWLDADDPPGAVAGLPADAPRVVMLHHPVSLKEVPAGSAPLAVAGHTHGGQVRLPFTPEWSWLTYFAEDEIHADGWAPDGYGQGGNRLYITRGIGMSLLPLRINSPPELTYFVLRQRSR